MRSYVPHRSYFIELGPGDAVPGRKRLTSEFGLFGDTFASAYDDQSGTLVLACEFGPPASLKTQTSLPPTLSWRHTRASLHAANKFNSSSTVVALDASRLDDLSKAIRWRLQLLNGCSGMAVLQHHGVVVCGSALENRLVVLRIADGVEVRYVPGMLSVSGAQVQSLTRVQLFAAPAACVREVAVANSDAVYASVLLGRDPDQHAVFAFRWDGARLVDEEQVLEAGVGRNTRPLAALRLSAAAATPAQGPSAAPPPPSEWHLVVGTFGSPTVRVLALPSRRVVWEGAVPSTSAGQWSGGEIWGLAADPCGAALIVCRAAGLLEALPWPWPGLDLRSSPHREADA